MTENNDDTTTLSSSNDNNNVIAATEEEEGEVKWDNNDYANAIGSAYKQEIETASQKPWF